MTNLENPTEQGKAGMQFANRSTHDSRCAVFFAKNKQAPITVANQSQRGGLETITNSDSNLTFLPAHQFLTLEFLVTSLNSLAEQLDNKCITYYFGRSGC